MHEPYDNQGLQTIAFCFAQFDDVFLCPDFPGGHGPIPASAHPAATPGSRTCRIRLVRLWKSPFGAMIQSVAPNSNWMTRPTSRRSAALFGFESGGEFLMPGCRSSL